ncbi:MarR family transcriptional regulator [Hymenobacter psychrotolerans]|nr:helix-turn-helix domain-containing protein [Hymenobacter psychrotolerans]
MAEASKAKTTFDLADLGSKISRMTPYGFLGADGRLRGFDTFEVPVRPADYDEAFTKKLLELNPIYQLPDFLSYHFDYFLSESDEGGEFLHHIEYVILPRLNTTHNTAPYSLVVEWLGIQKQLMFSQHKQQRIKFLEAAYKAACEYSPAQPLSVSINPVELGKELDMDRSTVSRIVNELVQDGHVTSTLGMKAMFVTREGTRELEGGTEPKSAVQQNFHFAQGSTSTVATGSNSVQVTNTGQGAMLNVASGGQVTQAINGAQATSLADLVEQLKQALDGEPKLESHKEDIAEELRRIDVQLQKPEPKKSILARSFETLHDLAKDGLGSATGHVVFELLQQVPHLLGAAF